MLVEVGGRNRCAAPPPQGLLLSLGVERHVSMAAASGQVWPEEKMETGGYRFQNKVWSATDFNIFKIIDSFF